MKNEAVHRDKDVVFQSIVDGKNKIVDSHKVFSGDFATEMDKNKSHLYNTLGSFRSRRHTVQEKPKPLSSINNFYM